MNHCTQNCSSSLVARPVGATESILKAVRQWIDKQRLKASIEHERASLLTMSDEILKDIGIDRATANREALRSDIPENRKR